MTKSMPRIGSQNLLQGIKKIIWTVKIKKSLSVNEFQEELEIIDENRKNKLFPDKKAWLDFTLKDKNRSVEILKIKDDKIFLTEEGERLVEASNFKKEFYKLMKKKSYENFSYFNEVTNWIQKKIENRNLKIGTNLLQSIDSIIDSNVTAQAISSFLKDLQIVEKNDGVWEINPSQYQFLSGTEEEILLAIIENNDNKIEKEELKNILINEFDWRLEKFNKVLEDLKREGEIYRRKFGGENVIFLNMG